MVFYKNLFFGNFIEFTKSSKFISEIYKHTILFIHLS